MSKLKMTSFLNEQFSAINSILNEIIMSHMLLITMEGKQQ